MWRVSIIKLPRKRITYWHMILCTLQIYFQCLVLCFFFIFYSALSNIHPLYIQCFLHASWALVWFAFLLPICFATVIATFYCILWHNPFVVYIPKGVILFKEGKHEFCITYYLKDAIEFIYSFPIFQWILHCQIRLTFKMIEYLKLKYFKNAIVKKRSSINTNIIV